MQLANTPPLQSTAPGLHPVRIHQPSPLVRGSKHPITAYYSLYRPRKDERLSQPAWLVAYRNKVPPPGVEPGHVTHPSSNRARRRVTLLIRPTPLPLRHAALILPLDATSVIKLKVFQANRACFWNVHELTLAVLAAMIWCKDASPGLWNQLHLSLCQPQLIYCFTHHFFLFCFTTLLIHLSFTLVLKPTSFTSPSPCCFTSSSIMFSRTITRTISSELLVFYILVFRYFLFLVPCARLSWPSHQLFSAHKFTIPWQRHIGVNNLPKVVTQLLPGVGFEPTTCWSQVQRSTHCATVPPNVKMQYNVNCVDVGIKF